MSNSPWGGVLSYQNRLCATNVDDLRRRVLKELHGTRYSIHIGSTKKYCDLREVYKWDGLMRDIMEFVSKCPNCRKVKV